MLKFENDLIPLRSVGRLFQNMIPWNFFSPFSFMSKHNVSLAECLAALSDWIGWVSTRGGSRGKYLGGLAPHHLGGNNG